MSKSKWKALINVAMVGVCVAIAIAVAATAPAAVNVDDSVVILTRQDEEKSGLGTGFVVAPHLILTAAHVAKMSPEGKLNVEDVNGKKSEAKTLWADELSDAALMEDRELNVPALPISCRALHRGDAVMAIGHPLGFHFAHTEGKIASEEYSDEHYSRAVLGGLTLAPGMSGGPIMKQGYVVGLSSAILTTGRGSFNIAAIVPGSQLCKLLGRK